MKWSNIILLTTLGTGLAGIFGANAILKNEYDKIDKSDKYWNYKGITDKHFKHINITGGNVSNIVYDQSPKSSVKIMRSWHGVDDGTVRADVSNDTLNIHFINSYKDVFEKFWLREAVPVRIAGPVVQSVTGMDTKLVLNKFNQPTLNVNLRGNSRLVINSYRTTFDRLDVQQSDSSLTTLAMSNEVFTNNIIKIKEVKASGSGVSLLNLRSVSVEHLQLAMSDSASVALSGYSLDKWNANMHSK